MMIGITKGEFVMEFIWECMVLALKTSIGGFFWSLGLGAVMVVVGLIFGVSAGDIKFGGKRR